MASRTFKYVDKDRIIPWIDKQVELNSKEGSPYSFAVIETYERVKKEIIEGLFDWQPFE